MSEINDIKRISEVTFRITLKFVQRYQQSYPTLMDKYNNDMYHKASFCGGINDNLSLIACMDKTAIPSIHQSYVLHWYHTYLLHPVLDRTETMIWQHLYWPNIRYAIRKKVKIVTFVNLQKDQIKYGKLPAKLSEEIPWNKLCVDIIGTYVIRRKEKK